MVYRVLQPYNPAHKNPTHINSRSFMVNNSLHVRYYVFYDLKFETVIIKLIRFDTTRI